MKNKNEYKYQFIIISKTEKVFRSRNKYNSVMECCREAEKVCKKLYDLNGIEYKYYLQQDIPHRKFLIQKNKAKMAYIPENK